MYSWVMFWSHIAALAIYKKSTNLALASGENHHILNLSPQNQQGFTFAHIEVGFEPQLSAYHFCESGMLIFVGNRVKNNREFQDGKR